MASGVLASPVLLSMMLLAASAVIALSGCSLDDAVGDPARRTETETPADGVGVVTVDLAPGAVASGERGDRRFRARTRA